VTPVELERWRRIRVSLAAWAYEVHDVSVMADHEFDEMCLQIDPKVSTGHRVMDRFFRTKFDPNTGSWVHQHPERARLEAIFRRYFI
jgi:hypothetical protein